MAEPAGKANYQLGRSSPVDSMGWRFSGRFGAAEIGQSFERAAQGNSENDYQSKVALDKDAVVPILAARS